MIAFARNPQLTLNQSVSGAPQAQYGLQYQYFANGAMKQMTYPAPGNRVVKYELDVIGRPVKVCGATCTPVSPEKNYAEIAAVGGGPAVQRALDSVPAGERSAFHGACAEIGCLNKLQKPA